MTRIRSDSDRISSSSSETSSTALPLSRCSTRRRWTNSIAPTSSPRVGWAAIRTLGFRVTSRAITTFCWLPPESAAAGVDLLQEAPRRAQDPSRPEPAEARERLLVEVVQGEVLRERELEHE